MNLRDAKKSLKRLTPSQLRKLDEWLHELIAQVDKDVRQQLADGSDVPEKKQAGQKTYRLERVRCGSKKCKCAAGELHGPYWYVYWTEGGRTRSQYIGKRLRAKKKR
jgi:hypothetical protein